MTQSSSTSRIVLGVDPGLYTTGYGIVQLLNGTLITLDYGVIKLPKAMELAERLCTIQESIRELILRYSIEALAIETQFVHRNVATALKLGMVRGVTLALAHHLGIAIYEYAPSLIKKSATGQGRASKEQMQTMIRLRLQLPHDPPEDAADALGMALCHLGRQEFLHPQFKGLS